eukprot:scaffold2150_cov137-Isochrysis_galbana.AAC.15
MVQHLRNDLRIGTGGKKEWFGERRIIADAAAMHYGRRRRKAELIVLIEVTRAHAFDRPGMRTAMSAYSRNSELQVAGARAANSSAVLNNGVISASWPSTGVEKGSRGSRPKSIASGLAYWSFGIVSASPTA